MFFLVNLYNHSELGQQSLADVVGIFGHQVRALGHKIIWDTKNARFLNTMAGEGMNIVVEGFTEPAITLLAQSYAAGARFIILATEEPTPKGFNHGTQKEMIKRQENFPAAAKYAEGIIHLVPGKHVTDWYGQFAPTAWTELGYAPSLIRISNIEPKYPFGFYGSLTTRRLRILKQLSRHVQNANAVRIVMDFPDQIKRDAAMQEARVIIQLRKFDAMGLVSSSRCNTALCIGRPVIAEPHDLSKPWDEIVTFTKTMDDFYNTCLMAQATWRGVHAAQMERFRQKLSPDECVGRALREIGILTDTNAAATAA